QQQRGQPADTEDDPPDQGGWSGTDGCTLHQTANSSGVDLRPGYSLLIVARAEQGGVVLITRRIVRLADEDQFVGRGVGSDFASQEPPCRNFCRGFAAPRTDKD